MLHAKAVSKSKNYAIYPELLDLHVLRLKEANRLVSTYMKDSELLRSGLMRFENFLGKPDLVAAISQQISASPIRDRKENDSLLRNLQKTPAIAIMAPLWPILTGLFQEDRFDEATNFFILHTYLQHLYNRPDDGDEQKVFHSDTFFHCVKFWYFPQDVSVGDGAFWYVPNSTVVTDKLLAWHEARVKDLKEGRAEEWRGPSHKEGSFRINNEELKLLDLTAVPVEVKADTLVIANVFGFHRRGDTVRAAHRLAIHGSIRISNPLKHSNDPRLS